MSELLERHGNHGKYHGKDTKHMYVCMYVCMCVCIVRICVRLQCSTSVCEVLTTDLQVGPAEMVPRLHDCKILKPYLRHRLGVPEAQTARH